MKWYVKQNQKLFKEICDLVRNEAISHNRNVLYFLYLFINDIKDKTYYDLYFETGTNSIITGLLERTDNQFEIETIYKIFYVLVSKSLPFSVS